MSYVIYDPDPTLPEDAPGPNVYGPFEEEAEAHEYANVLHPDDGEGNAVVLPLIEP